MKGYRGCQRQAVNVNPWLTRLPVILLFAFAAFKATASDRVNAPTPPPGDPQVLARLSKNLTKPLIRALIPRAIPDPQVTGRIVAVITDAVYCDPLDDRSARVIAQLTKSVGTAAAANLERSDCTASISNVASKHSGQPGFSGALQLTLRWTDDWKLAVAATDVAPAENSGFTASDL